MSEEQQGQYAPGWHEFEPDNLMRGSVGLGDTVRFRYGYDLITGMVSAVAPNGATVTVNGMTAGVEYVQMIEVASPELRQDIRIAQLEAKVAALSHALSELERRAAGLSQGISEAARKW